MGALDGFLASSRDDLLIERSRTGLWLCATSITLFGFTDPFMHPDRLPAIYALKAVQLALIAVFFWILRRPLTRSQSIYVAFAGVVMIAVTTAWSGIISGDDLTTPLLLTTLTMGTAALLPWGVRPQIFTQMVTALCVVWIGTTIGRYHAYLPIVVVVSSSFSIYMAYALERYRVEQLRSRSALADAQARQHQSEVAHAARLATLGGMAAGLAHELNQPLSAVVSYARGCARRLEAGDLPKAALLEVLEEISAQALRAGEVLRRIREFLRGESHQERVELNALVRKALRFAEGEARRANVQLALEFAPESLPVDADPIQIEQVILNLVQNGLEVMSGNNGTERVLTLRTRRVASDAVEVSVSDTGGGMSSEVASRLFDPFFSTKLDGLGLGLTISRSIVEAHGGRLWATPNAERGTTMHFTLRAHGDAKDDAA